MKAAQLGVKWPGIGWACPCMMLRSVVGVLVGGCDSVATMQQSPNSISYSRRCRARVLLLNFTIYQPALRRPNTDGIAHAGTGLRIKGALRHADIMICSEMQ